MVDKEKDQGDSEAPSRTSKPKNADPGEHALSGEAQGARKADQKGVQAKPGEIVSSGENQGGTVTTHAGE